MRFMSKREMLIFFLRWNQKNEIKMRSCNISFFLSRSLFFFQINHLRPLPRYNILMEVLIQSPSFEKEAPGLGNLFVNIHEVMRIFLWPLNLGSTRRYFFDPPLCLGLTKEYLFDPLLNFVSTYRPRIDIFKGSKKNPLVAHIMIGLKYLYKLDLSAIDDR